MIWKDEKLSHLSREGHSLDAGFRGLTIAALKWLRGRIKPTSFKPHQCGVSILDTNRNIHLVMHKERLKITGIVDSCDNGRNALGVRVIILNQ